VIAFDVLARGLLTSTGADRELSRRDVRRGDDRFDRERNAELLERRSQLEQLAGELSVPLCALAVRAALDRTGVDACLVGVKTPEQLEENLRYIEVPAGAASG
jgi:aryl-alcohol dehydrogenase-like predicted oxidoreductase